MEFCESPISLILWVIYHASYLIRKVILCWSSIGKQMTWKYHVLAVESKITKFFKLLWSATTCMNLFDFLTEHSWRYIELIFEVIFHNSYFLSHKSRFSIFEDFDPIFKFYESYHTSNRTSTEYLPYKVWSMVYDS